MSAWHITGTDPACSEPVDLWVADGVFVAGPVADAVPIDGYVLPGFVDAHCHVGYSATGAVGLAEAEHQLRVNLAAGVTAIRDCGSPVDTRPLADRADLPTLVRAGRHIARPKRYIRDLGVDLEDPRDLVAEVGRQVTYGGGWVKLVGDWIDREIGDLSPLWPAEVLSEAIAVAHAGGARVTAHVFGEDALPDLLDAGIDCIEHGTGLTDETIERMAADGVRLVPTLINIENFPSFADAATRFPAYAKHMRDLYTRGDETVARAIDAGVSVHAGTDAGGYIAHGRIADEVISLVRVGMSPAEALDASSWQAREWLGLSGWEVGARADLVVYAADPRSDLGVLTSPALVMTSGRPR